MSCLNATFTLTPKSPWFYQFATAWYGELSCYGADFLFHGPYNLASLYTADSFYFDAGNAADPGVDYSNWANRKRVSYVQLSLWVTSPKELALIFGFQTPGGGRVLVCDSTGLISDQTLDSADNQFLLEIESMDAPVHLYFIHAGGRWFFKGISGYLV